MTNENVDKRWIDLLYEAALRLGWGRGRLVRVGGPREDKLYVKDNVGERWGIAVKYCQARRRWCCEFYESHATECLDMLQLLAVWSVIAHSIDEVLRKESKKDVKREDEQEETWEEKFSRAEQQARERREQK